MEEYTEKFIDNGSISYEGKVTINLLKGNKTIKTYSVHNAGYPPLFMFLAQSLTGDYTKSESLRPRYIRLFSLGEAGTPYTEDMIAQHLTLDSMTSLTLSSYNTAPYAEIIQKTETTPAYARTIFKFLIPFTQINTSKATNMFALYSASNQLNYSEPSAVFVLTAKDETDNSLKLSSVLPPSVSAKSNEYNLQIQWEMNIKNR